MYLRKRMEIRKEEKRWRDANVNNYTSMKNTFDRLRVTVGNYTYGELYILMHSFHKKVSIGNFCSIAPDVCFIVESDHEYNNISTFPFRVKVLNESCEAISKGDIIVDDDVWIGQRATILSGVHIGQGAVIAAGAIVTKDVPPYAIVGGVPAKVIKYRFSPEIIEKLMKIDYSKLDKETVEKNIDKLYVPVTEDTDLSWLPQKR